MTAFKTTNEVLRLEKRWGTRYAAILAILLVAMGAVVTERVPFGSHPFVLTAAWAVTYTFFGVALVGTLRRRRLAKECALRGNPG